MKILVDQALLDELKSIILDLYDNSFITDEPYYIATNKALDALTVLNKIEDSVPKIDC